MALAGGIRSPQGTCCSVIYFCDTACSDKNKKLGVSLYYTLWTFYTAIREIKLRIMYSKIQPSLHKGIGNR